MIKVAKALKTHKNKTNPLSSEQGVREDLGDTANKWS